MHEKYKEFGGPDGGDGGKGGDVIFRADDNQNTLYWFKTHHQLKAQNGERGKKRRSHGKNAPDLIFPVPRGTIIIDAETNTTLFDLSKQEEVVVAKGGIGGFGNAHFTSSTRQAPRVAELGEPGEQKNLILEMKMIADVGLIGLPSVGKSTLLSVVTSARPKIAEYEFTTLIPNLGVVEEGNFGVERGFVMADIPGLIEGASQGKGLGDEFLRHIERTKVLVHLLDATHADLAEDYRVIRNELKEYKGANTNLSELPEIVVINKIDAISPDELEKKSERVQAVVKSKILKMSAVAHKNLPELMHEIEAKIKKAKTAEMKVESKAEPKVFTLKDVKNENLFSVEKEKDTFIISGAKIEKFAIRTDFSNPHAVARFRDILKKMGIDKELRRQGASEGDKIKVGGKPFNF